ncbi:MAG: ATP-dependent DNA ligase [Planctomycetota bacterium]|jgi:DNA ligase-1
MTLLADVAETSRRVAETRARREKIRLLAACLGRLAPDEIEPAVAFLAGEPRQGRIGIGYVAIRALAATTAAAAPRLTVGDVDRRLDEIRATAGRGSRDRRQALLAALLAEATAGEQRFLQRLLLGELRQGALAAMVADAVARAAGIDAADVRRAVMLHGDTGHVARVALTEGRAGLARFAIELFRPIHPMLARPAASLDEAMAALGRAALEWKLDGARIQVHRAGDEVRVYTRRLNDVTVAVPEVVEAVRRLPGGPLVLDGEAIALRADGSPRPFQETMRRFGRRTDVERIRRDIPLVPYFFDCLHRDGDDLVDRPGSERVAALAGAVPDELVVPRLVGDDPGAAAAFLDAALARGHEGVMAKSIDAPYDAGRRGSGWLKVKPAHTLDLVVLAAEWGSGRRQGWLSNLHLGARDPATGGFTMLGKTFKGMTDEMLAWQTRRLQEIELSRDRWTVHVRPELVVEVAFDGVQASPHYPGGLALRFARIRRYRDDKTAAQADTIDTVRAIHAPAEPGTATGFPAGRGETPGGNR